MMQTHRKKPSSGYKIKGTYCVSPVELRDQRDKEGNFQKVRCMQCYGCKRYRQVNWSINSFGEQEALTSAWFITLTYRAGETGENWLQYSDVQKMFKRLRKAGFPLRYLVAGEYGGMKGRPHWHVIIWWQGEVPEMGEPLPNQANKRGADLRREWSFWPYGHVTVSDEVDINAIRYISKYITKQEGRAGKFVMSKSPAIGQEFLDNHAARHAAQGSVPLRNWFRFYGPYGISYEGPLSQERWSRYREIAQEGYIKAGYGSYVPYPAYEKIIPQDEASQRAESRATREFEAMTRLSEYKPQAHRLIRRKGRESLTVYQRKSQWFARITRQTCLPWLQGVVHGHDGRYRDMSHKPKGGRLQVVNVAITPEQAAYMRHKKKPLPAESFDAPSDWLSKDAAQERKRRGLPPVALRLLQDAGSLTT